MLFCTRKFSKRPARHEAHAPTGKLLIPIINPGSEYGEEILRGCLVNFVDGEVQGYQ